MTRTHKSILVFAVVFAYFGILAAPDITWSNTGVDNGAFVFAAMEFPKQVLIHPSGYPLVNFINGVLAQPFETTQQVSHLLAITVALTSAVTAGLLFYLSRSYIAPLIFIASSTVVSQSIIVEVYALATLFSVLLYATRDSKWFALVAALSLGTHHIVGLAMLPILIYRWKTGKLHSLDALIPMGLLMYIPMFFGFKPEFVGWSNATFRNYFSGQSFMVLGLSPEDGGLLRLREAFPLFFGGLGITAFVFLKFIKEKWKSDMLLVAIAIMPFIYYWTHLLPQAFTYTMPGFAFIGLLIAKYHKTLSPVVGVTMSVGFAVMILGNTFIFHEDNPSARNFVNQLEKLPEDSVVWTNTRGWEQLSAWPEKLPITVVGTDKLLIQAGLVPSHISIITNASEYASTIIACDGWFYCYQWGTRDSTLEFDSSDESTYALLDGVDRFTNPLYSQSREGEN